MILKQWQTIVEKYILEVKKLLNQIKKYLINTAKSCVE